MHIIPYLGFDGQCREAFEFYADCLGGEIQAMLSGADTPMAEEMPPEARDRIMHAHLTVGEFSLMGGDEPTEQFQKPTGVTVSLHPETEAEAERLFARLSAGGEVQMPLQETFWSARFGMFNDRFGIPWMINCTIVPGDQEGC